MSHTYLLRWTAPWLIIMILSIHSQANEKIDVKWQTDFARAQQSRIEKGLPMIVFLTMDGCLHCERMVLTTYQDGSLMNQIRTSYVPAVINATRQEQLASHFRVRIFPTTVLVSPDNRIVDKIEGYVTAKELQRRLENITRRYAELNDTETR
jgi:thioredoxin-related protein